MNTEVLTPTTFTFHTLFSTYGGPVNLRINFDGLDLDLDVYLPRSGSGGVASGNRERVKRPTFVYFHGGAGFVGTKEPERHSMFPVWLRDLLVKRNGYIFIAVNYRLLIPTNAFQILEDVKNAFWFIASSSLNYSSEYEVDVDKIVVGGESFGAYVAKLAVLHAEPKPKALVSLYGMGSNFLTPYFFSGRSSSNPHGYTTLPANKPLFTSDHPLFVPGALKISSGCILGPGPPGSVEKDPRQDSGMFAWTLQQGNYLDYLVGQEGVSKIVEKGYANVPGEDSATEVNEYWRALLPPSTHVLLPQLNITPSFPPTFLVHGKSDTAILVDESRYFAKQLQDCGVKHQLIEVDGVDHAFDSGIVPFKEGDDLWERLSVVGSWLEGILE